MQHSCILVSPSTLSFPAGCADRGHIAATSHMSALPPAPHGSALEGLRVLDLSRVLAGPWCTQLLADLGADVIKIERPGRGDDTRHWGPPELLDAQGQPTGEAAYYLCANRGKRSVAIDLAQPAGQALVKRLAAWADVVIENYKPGQLTRWGLAPATLLELNPRLVVCSISGFGQSGPHASRPGYDYVVQGMSGFMSVTGAAEGEPGAGPQKAGVAVADLFTGLYATVAILAAIEQRHTSGRGQLIDLALFDSMVAAMANVNLNWLAGGKLPQRMGNAHPNIVPYQVFDAADAPLIVAVGNDEQFRKLCEVINRPTLAAEPRFASNAGRVAARHELVPQIAEALRTQPVAHWLAALDAAGVPAGPINTVAQALADPQIAARGLRIDLPHPLAGSVPLVGSPIRMSDSPPAYHRAPPLLGEHTDEVLAQITGATAPELAALRATGVIA